MGMSDEGDVSGWFRSSKLSSRVGRKPVPSECDDSESDRMRRVCDGLKTSARWGSWKGSSQSTVDHPLSLPELAIERTSSCEPVGEPRGTSGWAIEVAGRPCGCGPLTKPIRPAWNSCTSSMLHWAGPGCDAPRAMKLLPTIGGTWPWFAGALKRSIAPVSKAPPFPAAAAT